MYSGYLAVQLPETVLAPRSYNSEGDKPRIVLFWKISLPYHAISIIQGKITAKIKHHLRKPNSKPTANKPKLIQFQLTSQTFKNNYFTFLTHRQFIRLHINSNQVLQDLRECIQSEVFPKKKIHFLRPIKD